jgi:hypothetical protein
LVYQPNNRRTLIERQINERLGSEINRRYSITGLEAIMPVVKSLQSSNLSALKIRRFTAQSRGKRRSTVVRRCEPPLMATGIHGTHEPRSGWFH